MVNNYRDTSSLFVGVKGSHGNGNDALYQVYAYAGLVRGSGEIAINLF